MTPEPPMISVVISTLDRAPYLQKALKSLADQTPSDHPFETIVVDNGSSDDTARVCQAELGIEVHYVLEPRRGLSIARNAGWKRARGELVAFLDDDAIAVPGWIEAIGRAFQECSPKAGGIGGPIDLLWEVPSPSWITRDLSSYLGYANYGEERHPMAPHEDLRGGNVAYRRDVLKRAGGFHPALGRVGGRLISGEEIMLNRAMDRWGESRIYEPGMRILHHVPAARARPEWFYARAEAQGISEEFILHLETEMGERRPERLMERLAWTVSLAHPAKLRRYVGSAETDARIQERCAAYYELGRLKGKLWRKRIRGDGNQMRSPS